MTPSWPGRRTRQPAAVARSTGAAAGAGLRPTLAGRLTKGRPRVQRNLSRIAELRGETPEKTAEKVAVNLLRSVPAPIGGYPTDFDSLDLTDCGLDAGLPWIRTANGRVFYDYPVSGRDALMYVLLRDLLPEQLTVDTMGVATSVLRRYVHGLGNFPDGEVRVAVDAGCYIGFKAMAYADRVGPQGKVVAIEMMPDNYELLRRNVEANGLEGRIATVQCGLSDRPGTLVARRTQRQAATIADVDQLAGFAEEREVQLDTLANVFDRTIPDQDVDFLNVQVNGNELAVLDGLGPWKDRVRAFSVTSPYTREGQPLRDEVVAWFERHGIEVTEVGPNYVWARRS